MASPGKILSKGLNARMPELLFHPDIAIEIKASFSWYEAQAQGLGDDFINELEAAYQAILELPNTWPKFRKRSRRFLLRKFPFSVIYYPSETHIFIVAVMHNSRKPDYWIKRA